MAGGTKETGKLFAEVTQDLLEEFRAFVADRGDSMRDHLEFMMRKHLDDPPEHVPHASVRARGRPPGPKKL
jgi:hypothetical protein